METSAPALHDAILLAVGVAAVYLVVGMLQLLQLKSLRAKPSRLTCEPSLGILSSDASREEVCADIAKQEQSEALLKHLSGEVARLAAELQLLREQMRQRDESVVHAPKREYPRAPSKYNEAMRYARQGMSAAGIANKCGMSLAEAELVVALGRDRPTGREHDGQRAAA